MPERPAGLAQIYEEAAEATANGSKSFYFATRFFPPDLAQAAHAVYWFCRTTDDLVDEAPDVQTARAGIEAWERDLRSALETGDSLSPVLQVFAETARRYSIPSEYPLDLIAGVSMDLGEVRYESFEDLRVFCYRVASVVGLMMMHVIGYRGDPSEQAIDLGIAMQLTNILRDVGEDLRRGRIYLPLDEMREFGYSEAMLRDGVRNDAFIRLMQFQMARARSFYGSGARGIPALDARGRFSVEIASKVYAGILDRIEQNGYDVFGKRAVVPATRKYWITARSLAAPAVRQSLSKALFWR